MTLSRIAQLFIGVTLGVLIVTGASVGAIVLFMGQLTPPSKPKFATNSPETQTVKSANSKPSPYSAVVIYYDGLLLRENPESDAKTLKVLDFEESVQVLESSPDQKWQKVRIEADETLEGWVSAGNLERIEDPGGAESNEEVLPEEIPSDATEETSLE